MFRCAIHHLQGGLLSYLSEIFWGRQRPRQDVKVLRRFGTGCGDGVISRNVEKPSHLDAAVCPKNFIEFCRRISFNTYTHISAQNHIFLQGCYP